MSFTVPTSEKAPKIERVSLNDWEKGTTSAYDDGRTPLAGLRTANDVMLTQDAILRPRPATVPYGPQPTGTILGEVYEFTIQDGLSRETWMISMQNVSGTTNVYVAKGEDSSWTLCTGKTYDNTAQAHFHQVAGVVLVLNGVDNLSYLDPSTMTITGYTALSDPSAPTLTTNTGLTGTTFNVYYAVTANSTVGETAGSSVLTVDVSTDRDSWDSATQSIKISWSAVTNAQSYNVYCGIAADGAGQATLYAIATGLDAATLSFTDNGTRAQDLTRPLPTANSTAGPKASRAASSNGRPFLVGDADNPYYVWRGGDFGFELDFSPANGGGYTPVGSGTKEPPIRVVAFRNGKGDAQVMVLQQGTNGFGKRSYLNPTTVTYGSSTFIVWQVTEDSGQDGTDSPDGVIVYGNNVYYPSRDGFKTTGTRPQLQNILSTDRVSNTIQDDISSINSSAMSKCVGMAHEGRLYWSLPIASDTNNQIWVLDLDRKGAWMEPWNLSADWVWLYNDNTGDTHHLVLIGNEIREFTYSAKTLDGDLPFPTSFSSGQIKFSEDNREWGRLLMVIFVLLRPQGNINFEVSAKTEDGIIPYTAMESFGASATRAGWSEPLSGWSSLRGWSEIVTVPTVLSSPTEEVVIEVDEDVQWFTYGMNSTEAGVDYNLSRVIGVYVNVGIKDLT